jgi:hypothetical protein
MRTGMAGAARAATLAALSVLVGVGAASAAPQPAPSLGLRAAGHKVVLERHGHRVGLDLGIWVAAVGGAFQLDVSRPDYSAWTVAQVDADTGDTLREVPPELLDRWRGLDRFLRISFRDSSGNLVAARAVRFCPNDYNRQRVDDQGPANPTYPLICTSSSPFQRGMVWGIERGWAVSPRLGAIDVKPGTYEVSVRIREPYRDLFDVGPGSAGAKLQARVRNAPGGGGHPHPIPGPIADGGRPAQARSLTAAPTLDQPDPSTLPDLVALPLWNLVVHHRGDRDLLSFAATTFNAGPAPLVVEGFRRDGEDTMEAYQYFEDGDGNVVGRAPAGTMEFDTRHGHHHWHFEQFVRFSLLDGTSQAVVRSHKQSFCLAPTDPIDLTLPGAKWNVFASDGDLGSVCGGNESIWIRERLPAGWADTYFQFVAGQAFDVTDVPNGRYLVKLELNPKGELAEGSTENDVELREIRLGGRPGHRTVSVAPWHGITR